MNHMPCRKPVTSGDFGAAGLAAVQRAAFGQQFRARSAMDGAVNTAAAEQ
jgi:hypothetical protein